MCNRINKLLHAVHVAVSTLQKAGAIQGACHQVNSRLTC